MSNKSTFTLNRHKKIISGVCAGIGDYFDIAAIWVRLLFVFAAFTWAPTILAYFILYLIMSKNKVTPKDFANDLSDTYVVQKIKSLDYKKSVYKNKHNKKIQGVCYGIAQCFNLNPLFVRLAFLFSLLFGPFALGLYIILAFILDEEPKEFEVFGTHTEDLNEKVKPSPQKTDTSHFTSSEMTNNSSKHSASENIQNISKVFDQMEETLRKMEATVTSKKFKLHNEFKQIF